MNSPFAVPSNVHKDDFIGLPMFEDVPMDKIVAMVSKFFGPPKESGTANSQGSVKDTLLYPAVDVLDLLSEGTRHEIRSGLEFVARLVQVDRQISDDLVHEDLRDRQRPELEDNLIIECRCHVTSLPRRSGAVSEREYPELSRSERLPYKQEAGGSSPPPPTNAVGAPVSFRHFFGTRLGRADDGPEYNAPLESEFQVEGRHHA